MAKWIAPMIYNRTGADITGRTKKAFFNVADWLRIYTNSRIMSQIVGGYCGTAVPFTELSTPAANTYPILADINQLIANIDQARAIASLPAATGIVPLKYDWQGGNAATAPDYLAVNDWERDVQLIRDCLSRAQDELIYCGVANCGQPRFWQAQFHTWPFVAAASSPVRRPRCAVFTCGTNMTRQNSWRRYA